MTESKGDMISIRTFWFSWQLQLGSYWSLLVILPEIVAYAYFDRTTSKREATDSRRPFNSTVFSWIQETPNPYGFQSNILKVEEANSTKIQNVSKNEMPTMINNFQNYWYLL